VFLIFLCRPWRSRTHAAWLCLPASAFSVGFSSCSGSPNTARSRFSYSDASSHSQTAFLMSSFVSHRFNTTAPTRIFRLASALRSAAVCWDLSCWSRALSCSSFWAASAIFSSSVFAFSLLAGYLRSIRGGECAFLFGTISKLCAANLRFGDGLGFDENRRNMGWWCEKGIMLLSVLILPKKSKYVFVIRWCCSSDCNTKW